MTTIRMTGVLLLCGMLAGCQGQRSSGLDAEEQQWVSDEQIVPPTGGPMSPALPERPLRSAVPAAMTPRVVERVIPTVSPVPVVAALADPVAPPPAPQPSPATPRSARSTPTSPPAPVVPHAPFPQKSVAEQVRVSVYPSTIITCDGPLEVDYEHSKATFHDNVHVTDERGEMFADVMEVFFTPTHEISQVVSTGNVRIVRGEDTAYCERAVYLQQEGRVMMTGQPKLVLFPETTNQVTGKSQQPAAKHTTHLPAAPAARLLGEQAQTGDARRMTHDETPHE